MSKNIIFDCDGVLVNSEVLFNALNAEALSSIGYKTTAEECIRKFTGLSDSATQKIIKQETGITLTHEFMQTLQEKVTHVFSEKLEPLINNVLAYVNTHKIPSCVASGSTIDQIKHSLQVTNISQYFDRQHIFSAQLVTRNKPKPDLFLYASHQMQFDPKNTVVIEDSAVGIQAAKAAGMEVIAFLGGCHAKYQWYRDKISRLDIPIANSDKELLDIIQSI